MIFSVKPTKPHTDLEGLRVRAMYQMVLSRDIYDFGGVIWADQKNYHDTACVVVYRNPIHFGV